MTSLMKFRALLVILLLLLPGLPLRAASVKIPTVLLEDVQKGVERDNYRYYTVGVDGRAQFLYETERRIKTASNTTPFMISETDKAAILAALHLGEVADVEYTALAIRPKTAERLIRLRAITLDGAKNALILISDTGTVKPLAWLGLTPRFSPDGAFLAGTQLITDKDGQPRFEIAVLTLQTGEMRSLTADLKESACAPQWSPDGKWIAYDLVEPTYQAYVDCFWGRGVAAERFPDGSDWTLLTATLPLDARATHLIGWER